MKKFNLSLVTVLAMSTFAIAGGDIAPVEPVIETPMVEESTPGNFYLGLGYGMLSMDQTDVVTLANGATVENPIVSDDFSEVMVQAGYKFNPYIALEGRYWFGLEDTFDVLGTNVDTSVDAWGIYAKPMYPVTEAFNIYGLLGYGAADVSVDLPNGGTLNTDSVDGFSWGVGADYSFTENVAVFVDYVNIFDDSTSYVGGETDTTIDTVNFGVTYTF